MKRWLYRMGAALFVMLGIVGAILPVMPTTIFLILAVVCLMRAGDHRARLLLDHPRFGAPIRLFLEQGAITRRGKFAALGGISLGVTALVPVTLSLPWIGAPAMLVMAGVATFIITRPEPFLVRVPVQGHRCP